MTDALEGPTAAGARVDAWRAEGATIGFVPTMGALHEGHLSLVRAAKRRCDRALVSIFVNPLQFAPGEDLERYPRDFDGDREKLASAGCDAVFTATPEEMYPADFSTYVVEDRLSTTLEGASRPTHFRGVLTVVCKLFHVARPDVAFFGQKDAQQALLIRRMVRDLGFRLEVSVEPIVRDPDGLALSSRNAYLDPHERTRALSLSRALGAARAAYDGGERDAAELRAAARSAIESGGVEPEYLEVRDAETLAPLERVTEKALVLVAARVGKTRLIDNAVLGGDAL
ncbi:MAG: pantoate--beta-alanine ligase [Planctomycetota bacterium JB042]